ncbi:Z1 domain-containing protein [Sanguibacter gelidistatuariae]|uniref:Z1 domain-containing protein n=1 Tax=Sanguibacter gelidistatuariae TaxID=1814289 RepID=A0A1G6GTY7_9MICO|nr:Z1 domain-containing protein [Sanguibacter gelidistatuariae]
MVRNISDHVRNYLALGKSVDAALAEVLDAPWAAIDDDVKSAVREHVQVELNKNVSVQDPASLTQNVIETGQWYLGPSSKDHAWPRYEEFLRATIQDDATEAVDAASTRIVSLLRPPRGDDFLVRGLVLGYVQSGKTTSFISVMAKAFDAGYRVFVVMSGITENLRAQTQGRVDHFTSLLDEGKFIAPTDIYKDFSYPGFELNSQTGNHGTGVVIVVKKNTAVLRKLANWLEQAGATLRQFPMIVIDDEADQASIDVGSKGRTSAINKQIRRILKAPKSAYVAYTATPFANLLIDPALEDDLYPRDFLVSLPRPANYFGSEKIFGGPEGLDYEYNDKTGLDIIRDISEDEAVIVRPKSAATIDNWDPKVPAALNDALSWFLLATGTRRRRGTGNRHSTMLIHTSMLARAHLRLGTSVQAWLTNLIAALERDDGNAWDRLANLWEAECLRAHQPVPESFEDIRADVLEAARATRVVCDNYLSTDRLSYAADEPTTAIVIGGNTLSRGLTLEGLTSSYFVRSASAYDTLLQMGRWFGYREGYEDLVRIWMLEELQRWFADLSLVESEIRDQIESYAHESRSPADTAVRIRTHPSMAITAAAKMRSAIDSQMSYDGKRVQTILFNHLDADWLRANVDATRDLFAAAGGEPRLVHFPSGRKGFRNVPVKTVDTFLKSYKFHEGAVSMTSRLLTSYIRNENPSGALTSWNIVIVEGDAEMPTIDLGLTDLIHTITRSRMGYSRPGQANLKSIASTRDRIADVSYTSEEISARFKDLAITPEGVGFARHDTAYRQLRAEDNHGTGLLCIYPIDSTSTPRNWDENSATQTLAKNARFPLNAVDHMVGITIFFPDATVQNSSVAYKSADLSGLIIEDPADEAAEINAIDAAGEVEA